VFGRGSYAAIESLLAIALAMSFFFAPATSSWERIPCNYARQGFNTRIL